MKVVPRFVLYCTSSIVLSLFLTSCGFHLRGMMDMPRWLSPVAVIIENGHQDLRSYLVDYMKSYNINVLSDPELARYWLIIEQDYMQENITSVSSSTTPRQYELVYTVKFKLAQKKGVEIISTAEVNVTRQVTLNSNRILGSNQEEELLKNEMRRDAAIQIINRISRESSKKGNQS